MEERREAVEIIRRYVKGEIEEEPLLCFAERLDIQSIHRLSEALELRSEDFRRIGLCEGDLLRLLDRHLSGALSLERVRQRVRRIGQIFSASEYRSASVYRPQLDEALSLLRLVFDPDAPLSPAFIRKLLKPVMAALNRREPAPFSAVVAAILKGMGEFHFTVLTLDSRYPCPGEELCWADLALLYGPRPNGGAACADPREDGLAPVWFIPLAVTTRRFYHQELPSRFGRDTDSSWMHVENCKMGRLRERHPGLALARNRPLYLVDPRGFAEVILDVAGLGQDDLAFAARAFTLLNSGRAASLDGEPLEV